MNIKKTLTIIALLLFLLIFSTITSADISVQPIEISINMNNDFINGNTSKKITITNNNDYNFNVTWYKEHPNSIRPNRTNISDLSWIDVEPKWIIIPPKEKGEFYIYLNIPNVDENLHNAEGVELKGIIYGGRDSDTSVPVEEAFNWEHGIITKGASLESETTAATLGSVGKRVFNPMSNLDFLSVPIAKYIENNLDFGKNASDPLKIFSVNYFIKDKEGNFLNEKTDKSIWIKWMDLRCHNEANAIKTPTGYIPEYENLKNLFSNVLNKDYSKEDYKNQFTIRIPENLSKIERIIDIYKNKIPNTPDILFKLLEEQKQRLQDYKDKYGDYISPFDLKE